MRRKVADAKTHIISMRISDHERETLRAVMKCLRLASISDVMREAFKQISMPPLAASAPGRPPDAARE